MKLSTLSEALSSALPLLCCPLCSERLDLAGNSLTCASGHCFDLSSKGYVNLAPSCDQSAQKYDAFLFDSRRRVFDDGFYTPVLEMIASVIKSAFGGRPFTLLDVGCGEGYYARSLASLFPSGKIIGVDLNRDAIIAAARGLGGATWFVADLKRLPFCDHAFDVILDVLTPADYTEFERVLAPGGELIKLIPGEDYLCEVRSALSDHLRGAAYDGTRVVRHLQRHTELLERVTIRRTFSLTPEQSRHFLRMTPMTFSIPEEELARLSLAEITVHLELLRCRPLPSPAMNQ